MLDSCFGGARGDAWNTPNSNSLLQFRLEAIPKKFFGPIAVLGVQSNSSKYNSIQHVRHWLRWHLGSNEAPALILNQNPFFEIASI